MVLILYKNTNIFNKYMLILHKLTLCFNCWIFGPSIFKHSSTKQERIIYADKFVIEMTDSIFLTDLFSVE